MSDRPATPAQLGFLRDLTRPERLGQLSAPEASFLISVLREPNNASRPQMAFLFSLVERLNRKELQTLHAPDLGGEGPGRRAPSPPVVPH